MSRVYLDSMVWVYALESNERFGVQAQSLLKAVRSGRHTLLASHFLLAELLVGPQREGDLILSALYRRLLSSAEVEIVPLSERFALTFAYIRSAGKVSAPDAIHLALAAGARADLFITGDTGLQRLAVPGIGQIADLGFQFARTTLL